MTTISRLKGKYKSAQYNYMQILTSCNNQLRNIDVLILVFGGSSLILLRRLMAIKLAVFATSTFCLSLLRLPKHRWSVVTTFPLASELLDSRCKPQSFNMAMKPVCPNCALYLVTWFTNTAEEMPTAFTALTKL